MNNGITLIQRVTITTGISLLLASCGGGNDNPNIPSINPDADAAYTGSRDPALLTRPNTLQFVNLLYGNTLTSDGLLNRPVKSEPSFTNILSEIKSINHLIGSKQPSEGEGEVSARSVSQTVLCAYGGEVSGGGEINDSAQTESLTYTFTNCEENEGVILNGVTNRTIHSSSAPYSHTIKFDQLSISQNGNKYTQTGTLTYREDNNSSETRVLETVNLVTHDIGSDQRSYLNDVVFDSTYPFGGGPGTALVSGELYLSDQGYISLSGTDDLSFEHPEDYTPLFGSIYLDGASDSQARIRSTEYYMQTNIDLDQDGDGSFEASSIQYLAEDTLVELTDNLPPIAVLEASDIVDFYYYYDTAPEILNGDTAYLFGENSSDPEGDTLTYKWTIESAPEGSTASFTEDRTSKNNTFTPDIQGLYKISLKVTDALGSGESDIATFDIDTSNRPPSISWPYDDPEVATEPVTLGYQQYYYFETTDLDTPFVSGQDENDLIHSYELVEAPALSQALLTLDSFYESERYPAEYNDDGVVYSGGLTITPDVPGTYKIKLTATDYQGESTSVYQTITVLDDTPVATIECYANCGDAEGNITRGNVINLAANVSSEHSWDLYYDWFVVSEAKDSTGVELDVFMSIDTTLSFAPQYLGRYFLYLAVTSPSGEQTTIRKTYTVID